MTTLKFNSKIIASNILYADTFFKKIKGLMFRSKLDSDSVMVFIFKKPTKVNIHMLFVPFPIDIIFLDANKRIVSFKSLRAWIGFAFSKKKISYLLEANKGFITKHNLKEGDYLYFYVP